MSPPHGRATASARRKENTRPFASAGRMGLWRKLVWCTDRRLRLYVACIGLNQHQQVVMSGLSATITDEVLLGADHGFVIEHDAAVGGYRRWGSDLKIADWRMRMVTL